jgi:ATP-dependent DNA helicase RecQ
VDSLSAELSRLFGHDDFREGQREIVESAVAGRDTLAILPTGGGKSLTYQLPAMLLPGATLILSPLIALMKDQTENLPPEVAERTTLINSSLEPSEVGRRLARVRDGQLKLIYAAPERLRQPPFLHALRRAGLSLIVIDEAHCISQWGHDFRPDYRAVGQAVQSLNPRSVLAVTATATSEVQVDIESQLGRKLHRLTRPTWRKNLYLESRKVKGEDDKLWATLELCQKFPGAGLVYCQSREKCEQIARMLKRQGVAADFYHAGLPPAERAAAQDRFMAGEIRVMTATVAFGMGVDKSDIRFLLHYHPSRTLENYYQEAGRAGRDGAPSTCILLHASSDAAGATRRLNEDTLTFDRLRSVYNSVKSALGRRRVGGVSFESISAGVDGDDGLVRQALPVLEEQGLILRHTDIPRRMTLYSDFLDESAEAGPFDSLSGEFDPVGLSESVGISLPELESSVLAEQDAGRLTYRAGQRDLLLELLTPPPDSKARLEQVLAHRARGASERMQAMRDYARLDLCRHKQIARYFGDAWPHKTCGVCDVCHPPSSPSSPAGRGARRGTSTRGDGNGGEAREPPTGSEGLAGLSIVGELAASRSPFALGKSGLVRTLRGTPDAPVREGRVKGFGALGSLKKAEVERLVEALIEKNYLLRDDEDEYRRLHLTEKGTDALSEGTCDITWRTSPVPRAPGSKVELDPDADPDLLASLKDWRRALASENAVPPYVIFADKTLMGIAARKPANEFDLQEVPGIGPAKAAKFGEAVLEIVKKHG